MCLTWRKRGYWEPGRRIVTPVLSVVSGGVACIVATLIILALVPNLARVKVK